MIRGRDRHPFPVRFISRAGYSGAIVSKTSDITSQGRRTPLFFCVGQLVARRDRWVAARRDPLVRAPFPSVKVVVRDA
jgi:hypothetical protein